MLQRKRLITQLTVFPVGEYVTAEYTFFLAFCFFDYKRQLKREKLNKNYWFSFLLKVLCIENRKIAGNKKKMSVEGEMIVIADILISDLIVHLLTIFFFRQSSRWVGA